MPTLNKFKRRKKIPTVNKQLAQKIYNTPIWKKMRLAKLMENSLCEVCLTAGEVTPAVHVHHIYPFSKGETFQEMKEIAYDATNLMSLCVKCHDKYHKKYDSNSMS